MPKDTWDDYAADWDTDSDVQTYASLACDSWHRKVAPLYGNLQQIRVLDFGCGTGLLTEKISPLCETVVAIDSSIEMIKVLERKVAGGNLSNVLPAVSTIDVQAIAQRADILFDFDLVLASSVCSFLPDFEGTLCDIVSIMKPGGLFVQWDWASDMSEERIGNAYGSSGLHCLSIGIEFEMNSETGACPVVMAVGQKPILR